MYKPELFSKVEKEISVDAEEVLDEFKNCFQWSPDGGSSLLDIGCANGSFTNNYILPLLPENSGKVVGADISEQMVKFAADTYAKHNEKIQFKQMDIAADDLKITEKYDVVTSFYCFHFVQNIRQTFKNIYNLLKPGGSVLIVHMIYSVLHAHNIKSTVKPRWSPYIKQKNVLVECYENFKKAEDDFSNILKEEGFTNIFCEAREHVTQFKNVSDFLSFAESTNVFDKYLPTNLRTEYYKESLQEMIKKGLVEDVGLKDNQEPKVFHPKTTLVIFARKL